MRASFVPGFLRESVFYRCLAGASLRGENVAKVPMRFREAGVEAYGLFQLALRAINGAGGQQ